MLFCVRENGLFSLLGKRLESFYPPLQTPRGSPPKIIIRRILRTTFTTMRAKREKGCIERSEEKRNTASAVGGKDDDEKDF